MRVKPFQIFGKIPDDSPTDQINPRLISVSCKGHSPTDACFLDMPTRTLFVGDLFYLGPVFYFLPGSDLSVAIETFENLLKRTDWDHVALTHGECLADRSKVVEFVEDLKQVVAKKASWKINFDFWIPLRAYKVRSGYVVTNLIW
jgi:glyoxylase-like metal-dependent hydrolase (beta-lactamase superfamily II)